MAASDLCVAICDVQMCLGLPSSLSLFSVAPPSSSHDQAHRCIALATRDSLARQTNQDWHGHVLGKGNRRQNHRGYTEL